MKTNESTKSKTPTIVVDKSLNDLQGINFFPERLKQANEFLKKAGLPDLSKLK
ncbi:hypothetical protein [Dyadobacter fanqingshengii]|uniref:Uncharacterized protein n=1 Tax=Dyadobacter fanqingshengii TaxID=2906443 RepID=A0A9X1P4R2_9BACT|nr:hypothetical protein [Dyadobacter fanqingshengii]MCF0038791.1 hypothetical protein [Dyadobacter fanqingshengii]USJ34381.1 hypothetical protein NFI81_16890 [Dyadobacter fanqingshengii]